MKSFHAIIRPLGETRLVNNLTSASWGGEAVAVWGVADDSPGLATQSFAFDYDTLQSKLSEVARLYIEPDGSFVWVSSEDASRRISGQITDDGERVLYLELRGKCRWNDLSTVVLKKLDWPETSLAFQLLPESLLVEEQQFRDAVCGD